MTVEKLPFKTSEKDTINSAKWIMIGSFVIQSLLVVLIIVLASIAIGLCCSDLPGESYLKVVVLLGSIMILAVLVGCSIRFLTQLGEQLIQKEVKRDTLACRQNSSSSE